MTTRYKNGNIITEMTPREAAIYNLMLGGYTEQEANKMLEYIHQEAIKRLNITLFKINNQEIK